MMEQFALYQRETKDAQHQEKPDRVGITFVFTLEKLFSQFAGNKDIPQGIEKRGI